MNTTHKIVEIQRLAKEGEQIKITSPLCPAGNVGDIFTVHSLGSSRLFLIMEENGFIAHDGEYVVLEIQPRGEKT